MVFDSVDNLLACSDRDDVTSNANQLALWIRSFGATVVLVANGDDCRIIESLMPTVRDSFRFEVRENINRAVRFMAFEKSQSIPDQAVRVDPSRGISLLPDQQTDDAFHERLGPDPENHESLEACDESGEIPIRNLQTLDPQLNANTSTEQLHTSGALDTAVAQEAASDAFFAMLDELQSFVSSIDP
jgi:hypothetical protein